MYGPPIEITSTQDLLVYGGLAFLAVLGLLSILMPRWLRR